MERLTSYKNETSREMICRYEDCDVCEEYCPHMQEDNCFCLQEILEKLGQYEDAEEQGLLFRLPCKRGDDVYIIPSKVNYDLNVLNKHEENNRVHHQKVENITFNRNGWYVECDKDVEYGTDIICIEQHFGITWFLDPTKAEQKLAEMKGE